MTGFLNLQFLDAQQVGDTSIRKTLALETEELVTIDVFKVRLAYLALDPDQILDLHQKPGVDAGQFINGLDRPAHPEGISHIPDPFPAGFHQFPLEHSLGITETGVQPGIKAAGADFQSTQCLLNGLLERAPDGHHLADGFHLGCYPIVGFGEFLEGETRYLGDHIVNGRLKGGRGRTTGNLVSQFVQGEPHSQLGSNPGNGKAGGFGGQGGRSGNPRIHLDDHQTAIVRVYGELHVGAPGVHPDFPKHGNGRIAKNLVFLVGQGLRRRYGDGIAGVNPHGVKVLDGADDDAVILVITHDLKLILLPAD